MASLPLSLLQEVEVGAPAEARPFFFFLQCEAGTEWTRVLACQNTAEQGLRPSKSRRVTRQPLERSQTKPMKVGYKEDWSGTPVGLILQTDIFLGDILGTE